MLGLQEKYFKRYHNFIFYNSNILGDTRYDGQNFHLPAFMTIIIQNKLLYFN
jgi:hypothetical protein